MNINIIDASAERSLHGNDEVWVQVQTTEQDQLLDWPSVKDHLAKVRPDLALPMQPKSYIPCHETDSETGQIVLEDWWVLDHRPAVPSTDQWGGVV